ncbi:MAG: nucleotidyltransferase family protein [Anaerolineae bacterium]|nr:nucleotidyltransferase family protein [Anaerolineae bacterium]
MSFPIPIPHDEIAAFCARHHIRKLALFGSVLRDDFRPDSDVDVLVEFDPGVPVGFFTFVDIEQELSNLLGRTVDLNTAGFLHKRFRQQVIETAQVIYERTRQDAPV